MARTCRQRRTRSQHYVARASLRQFGVEFYQEQEADSCAPHYCARDNGIYALCKDGVPPRKPTGVMVVAQETYFYELRDKAKVAAIGGPQAVETHLSDREGRWSASLRALLTATIPVGMPRRPPARPLQKVLDESNADDRITLSTYAAVQMIRTRAFRNHLQQVLSQSNPEMTPQDLEECAREAIAELVLVGDQVAAYGQTLAAGIWILGINDSAEPLYASDHPMVGWGDSPSAIIDGEPSYLPKSMVMLLPLSYKVILQIYEPTYWGTRTHPVAKRRYRDLDGFAYQLTDSEVADCNAYQRVMRERFLLSPTNSFVHSTHQPPKQPLIGEI